MITSAEQKPEIGGSIKINLLFCHVSAALLSGAIVSVISSLVLIGWLFEIDFLKRIIPGNIFMNPTTAAGLILSSISLWLLQSRKTKIIHFAKAFAVIISSIGLLKLCASAGFFDTGIDRILFRSQQFDTVTGQLNQMSPNTALNFLLFGAALLLLNSKRRTLFSSQYLAIVVVLTSFLSIIGDIYGAKTLFLIISFNLMAIHTAASFFVLAVGLLLSRPEQGIIKDLLSRDAGGETVRRLFPLVIIIPAFLGWLRLYGEKKGFYTNEMGTAMLVVAIILILGTIILSNARSMNNSDSNRKRIEEELTTSKALLTKFVAHTPAAVAMLDTEMRYLQVSGRWLQDYKLAGQDIIGKSHYEVFPDISDNWKEIHQRCLAGAIEKCDEDPFPRADGTIEWLQWETARLAALFFSRRLLPGANKTKN
jgi:PAS domain-containing protein